MDALDYIVSRYNIDLSTPNPHRLEISRFGDFLKILRNAGYKTGAEIGVDRGRMSRAICKAILGVKLLCVDPWTAYSDYHDIESQAQMDENEQVARARLAPYDCEIIKASSLPASNKFSRAELDFVWIDGNHTFDYVIQDIIAWEKVVRPGGIVAGHDYNARLDFGVIEAVDAYTLAHKIDPWFLMTKDFGKGWFWVKR